MEPRGDQDDQDDPERRFPRTWHGYLVTDDRETLIRLPGRLLDRIHRQSDGTLQWHLQRAVEMYAEHLEREADSGFPGSSSPPAAPYQAPAVVDPVSDEEKRALAAALRAGPAQAVEQARARWGAPTVAREAPPAPRTAPPDMLSALQELLEHLEEGDDTTATPADR